LAPCSASSAACCSHSTIEAIIGWFERQFGFDFIDPSIYYISKLPSDLHWDDVGLIGSVAFALTLLATLYPAWRAARVQPRRLAL